MDAAERLAARRRELKPELAPLSDEPAAPWDEPVFADQRILGAVEAGFLIPRSRLVRALEVLGISDPPSVAAVQIDTDLQVTVVRCRHDVKPGKGGPRRTTRLVREHAYFTPKES